MTQIILTAILTLIAAPPPSWGETQPEFRARMAVVATAIDKAVVAAPTPQKRHLAMALVVTFWGESRFAPDVHSGVRLGDYGRAICLGQAHRGNLSAEEWSALAGVDLESTTRCASVAAQRLLGARNYCRRLDASHSWPEAFVLYGTGRTCRASETPRKRLFADRASRWKNLVR